MLLIDRQYLCVYSNDTEIDAINAEELKKLLKVTPSFVVYFESSEKLYGLISFGDIKRAGEGDIPINRDFISLRRNEYMKARAYFKNEGNIYEIPVVDAEGKLIGEFDKYDDELMLKRARSVEYNAYSEACFSSLKNIALVKPLCTRAYKYPYYQDIEHTLERYHTKYTEISFQQMIDEPEEFETYIVVDEQEKRGARVSRYLNGQRNDNIITWYTILSKLESSEIVDFKDIFTRFYEKGVDVILLTAPISERAYEKSLRDELKTRFPDVKNNLNQLMRQYENDFFDDLADQKDLVEDIENGYFMIEKEKNTMRLMDVSSKYVNVKHGERVTIGQPEEYTRTIFFFGPCLVIGAYVSDEYTIESCLQKMINSAGYKVRVVNCGCWGGNVASVSRMVSSLIREGDIVVAMLEEFDIQDSRIKKMNLWNVLEKYNVSSKWLLDLPYHANHHVCALYAKELFSMIFTDNYKDLPAQNGFIHCDLDVVEKFFIKKYFNGVDLAKYSSVSCCVVNGNPFTNGHRYLIETAAKNTEHVYLLSVKEDSSIFSFAERYAMAFEAVKDLDNVTVVPSGLFIGNISNFPAYYAKVYTGDARQQAESHVEAFLSIAKLLHVTHRYVGEEPLDPVASDINLVSKLLLPKHGIETIVLPRKEENGVKVTGAYVRKLAEEDNCQFLKFVPASTADIIRCETINHVKEHD